MAAICGRWAIAGGFFVCLLGSEGPLFRLDLRGIGSPPTLQQIMAGSAGLVAVAARWNASKGDDCGIASCCDGAVGLRQDVVNGELAAGRETVAGAGP
jgi:hypothetical protein